MKEKEISSIISDESIIQALLKTNKWYAAVKDIIGESIALDEDIRPMVIRNKLKDVGKIESAPIEKAEDTLENRLVKKIFTSSIEIANKLNKANKNSSRNEILKELTITNKFKFEKTNLSVNREYKEDDDGQRYKTLEEALRADEKAVESLIHDYINGILKYWLTGRRDADATKIYNAIDISGGDSNDGLETFGYQIGTVETLNDLTSSDIEAAKKINYRLCLMSVLNKKIYRGLNIMSIVKAILTFKRDSDELVKNNLTKFIEFMIKDYNDYIYSDNKIGDVYMLNVERPDDFKVRLVITRIWSMFHCEDLYVEQDPTIRRHGINECSLYIAYLIKLMEQSDEVRNYIYYESSIVYSAKSLKIQGITKDSEVLDELESSYNTARERSNALGKPLSKAVIDGIMNGGIYSDMIMYNSDNVYGELFFNSLLDKVLYNYSRESLEIELEKAIPEIEIKDLYLLLTRMNRIITPYVETSKKFRIKHKIDKYLVTKKAEIIEMIVSELYDKEIGISIDLNKTIDSIKLSRISKLIREDSQEVLSESRSILAMCKALSPMSELYSFTNSKFLSCNGSILLLKKADVVNYITKDKLTASAGLKKKILNILEDSTYDYFIVGSDDQLYLIQSKGVFIPSTLVISIVGGNVSCMPKQL